MSDKPQQLSLFELLPHEKKYSNTIEFYDALPKYYWDKAKRYATQDDLDKPDGRTFRFENFDYYIEIVPAVVKVYDRATKSEKLKVIYPGKREELIEQALRKIATQGRTKFYTFGKGEEGVGLAFTLYEVQKELNKQGHHFSINEIKEGVYVCSRATIVIYDDATRKKTKEFNYMRIKGLEEFEDIKKQRKNAYALVIFNELVSSHILKGKYRLINYDKNMSLRRDLARYLHRRLSSRYRQARFDTPYSIKLLRLLNDSGVSIYHSLSKNISELQKSFADLQEKQIILKYQVERLYDPNNKRKIVDADITLYPHPEFVSEVRKANVREKEVIEGLSQLPSGPTAHLKS